MIKSEVHTDDRNVFVTFDATPWFEQASDEEPLDLEEYGWGGDYPSDNVAKFFDGKIEGITDLFKYISILSKGRNSTGFECFVDGEDARAWINANRPGLLKDGLGLVKMICRYCCRYCGSEAVRRNADAIWNTEKQEWQIVALFDSYDCEKCEGETDVVEKPLKHKIKQPRSLQDRLIDALKEVVDAADNPDNAKDRDLIEAINWDELRRLLQEAKSVNP